MDFKDKTSPVKLGFYLTLWPSAKNPLIKVCKDLQLVYSLYNNVNVSIDSIKINLSPGEATVIPPDSLYSIDTKSEQAVYHKLVLENKIFSCLDLQTYDYTPCAIENTEIKERINQISFYYKAHDEFYETKILSEMLFVLALVFKIAKQNDAKTADKNKLNLVKTAIEYIEQHYFENISLDKISEILSVNKSSFSRIFKEITNITFISYLNIYRCEMARRLIINENKTVIEAANMCGFYDASYFSKTFKRHMGILPSAILTNSQKLI